MGYLEQVLGFFGLGDSDEEEEISTSGYHVLGAGPAKKTLYGPAVKVKPNPDAFRHKTVVRHGEALAAKTQKIAAEALKKAAQHKSQKTLLHGAEVLGEVIGVPLDKSKLSLKQVKAVSKHEAAIQKSDKAAVALADRGKKAQEAAAKLTAAVGKQKTVAAKIRASGTRLHGIGITDGDIAAYCRVTGEDPIAVYGALLDAENVVVHGNAFGLDAQGLSSGQPGYDATTDLDASAAPDATTLPPAPSMDTFISDMDAVGGIPYDGSKGTPVGFCGSYGYFYETTTVKRSGSGPGFDANDHYGYVFGGNKNDSNWPGEDPNTWVSVHGGRGRKDWWDHTTLQDALTSPQKNSPNGAPYGPLIGNPAMKDFAAMRVDGQGRMFWLPQEAPDWLTFPLRQAAALTAKAAKDAAQAAAEAQAAAAAKDAADREQAAARQEAENALAEKQAESEAKIAQTKQATERAQADLDAQKAQRDADAKAAEQASQQAAFQIQAQQAQLQLDQRAAEIDLQRQQAQPYDAQAPQPQPAAEYDQPESPSAEAEMSPPAAEGDFFDQGGYDGGIEYQDMFGAEPQAQVASVRRDGSCLCPRCGCPLRLILAPPPAVAPGRAAGVVHALGMALPMRPAIRARTEKSCLCTCPSCGGMLRLSVGPEGYDGRGVAMKVGPTAYHALAEAVHAISPSRKGA